MRTSIIFVVTCHTTKQLKHSNQFKSLQARVYISIETSNIRTKGARALAVRDSNVSKWCLRARKGIVNTREKTFYFLRTKSTKVSHLVSCEVLSGLVPRPLARYKSK